MRKPLFFLIAVLLISFFFRAYDIVGRFGYAHDAELFSWIVKDIVVNQHPRLIGQLTSAEGIFIGPLFYYLLVPFFLLFNMDPVGGLMLVTIFGILTTYSYYWVFSKLFNQTSGLIAAFLHSFLVSWVEFDRKVVPSTLTNLWVVWYFFTIIQIARGNFFVFPLLGILIGLIWHIHIALLPTLLAVPFALLAARKLPSKKTVITFLITVLVTNLPLIIFETRHSFIQTKALIGNFTSDHGGGSGLEKLFYVINMISKNMNNLLLTSFPLPLTLRLLFIFSILSLAFFLLRKKIITKREVITLSSLIIGVISFFTLSSSLVSEYYIYSLEIIFIGLIALTFSVLIKQKIWGVFVVGILTILFANNLYHFLVDYRYKKDYEERKAVVEFITSDAKSRGFPCIGISYITTPGENTGFRYFFYLKNQHMVKPSLDVPVYNIVIPDELSPKEVTQKYGHIGIIPPTSIPPKEVIDKSCQAPNSNLTEPVLGYVE